MSEPPRTSGPPPIASDEDYARLLGSTSFWEPYARAALADAGLAQPARLEVGVVGTYPTVVCDTGTVVKLFGDRWCGPDGHLAERAAFRVLRGSDLPVPALLAEGALFPGAAWPWPYLVLSRVPGRSYGELERDLTDAQRIGVAARLGGLLRRLHALPLPPSGDHLAVDWRRFLALLDRRRRQAPGDHRRWGHLPARLCDQLEAFLPDPRDLLDLDTPPAFVHADLHADHVFLCPGPLAVTGLIDFNDAYAGDARYDLVAAHFGTFRCRKDMLAAFLQVYGWGPLGDAWCEAMLAFTLLHDFDMFHAYAPGDFDDVATLAELAGRLWDPRVPEELPRSRGRQAGPAACG